MRTALASTLAVLASWTAAFLGAAAGSPVTAGVIRIIAADALVIESAVLAVCAPIAGVALSPARSAAGGRGARLRRLALPAVVFTLVSCAAALAAASTTGMTMALALRSHVTLGAVALALTALGALCAAICRDVLDAAAAAVGVSIAMSAAVLVGGPALAGWPQPLVDAGLLASPPIAVSASAGLDLLRGELLYQLSPIAHRRFTYPAWQTSAAVYAAAAAVFALGTVRKAQTA